MVEWDSYKTACLDVGACCRQCIDSKQRYISRRRVTVLILMKSLDSYRSCLARAKRALSSGVFREETLQAIEQDILVTLPALRIFHPESGPLYQDLKDLLCAWVVSRADEGLGYIPGTSRIAAMILINMSAPQGFVVMRNLLERHCLRSFYGDTNTKDDVSRINGQRHSLTEPQHPG